MRELATDHTALREPRARACQSAATLFRNAGQVYADPRRACRLLLRSVRRQGARRTLTLMTEKPETFGRFRATRGTLLGVVPIPSTTDARAELPRFLYLFETAARARAGDELRARERWDAALAQVHAFGWPERDGTDPLREAARTLAILYRRRAVDEPPAPGSRLVPIEHQLSALLPPVRRR